MRKLNRNIWQDCLLKCGLLLMFFLPAFTALARQADSLTGLKLFMAVCSNYKQVPMHATITVQGSADIITSPEDTVHYVAEFFIQTDNAYVKIAGEEQLINDSLMLFVSNKLRRMILYPNPTGSVGAQLGNFSGMLMQDSSVKKMAEKYHADILPVSPGQPSMGTIQVISRATVPGTPLPKETIEVSYNQQTKQPVNVVQLHRKMIPLDSVTYVAMLSKALYPGKLINPAKGVYFLLKESSTSYVFTQIDYDYRVQLPVKMSNCIIKNQTGHYTPAKGYGMFRLSENLW